MNHGAVRRSATNCCANFQDSKLSRWLRIQTSGFSTGPRSKFIRALWKRARKVCWRSCGAIRRGRGEEQREGVDFISEARLEPDKASGKTRITSQPVPVLDGVGWRARADACSGKRAGKRTRNEKAEFGSGREVCTADYPGHRFRQSGPCGRERRTDP